MGTERAEKDSASIQECCPEAVVTELVYYDFEKRNQIESILSNFPSSTLVSRIMVIKNTFLFIRCLPFKKLKASKREGHLNLCSPAGAGGLGQGFGRRRVRRK